ncbi:unnamed protein product [Laminaria digitata]
MLYLVYCAWCVIPGEKILVYVVHSSSGILAWCLVYCTWVYDIVPSILACHSWYMLGIIYLVYCYPSCWYVFPGILSLAYYPWYVTLGIYISVSWARNCADVCYNMETRNMS